MNRRNFILNIAISSAFLLGVPADKEIGCIVCTTEELWLAHSILVLTIEDKEPSSTHKIIKIVNAIRAAGLNDIGAAIYKQTKEYPHKCILTNNHYSIELTYTPDPRYPYNG